MKRKNENKLLAGRSIHEGELILVNARYPVMAANPAGKVISLKDSGVSMERRAASVLLYIMKSIGGEGAIEPVSGYRTEGSRDRYIKIRRLTGERSLRENTWLFPITASIRRVWP